MTSSERQADLIVVGSGIAGLSAAVTAVQAGLRTVLVERAKEGEHGGNTRYTEAYLRMKAIDQVADDFEEHLAENSGGYVDPTFLQEASGSPETWSSLMRSLSMLDPAVIAQFAESPVRRCSGSARWASRSISCRPRS